MTDLSRTTGDPGTGSEDGPAPDTAFPITVDSHPGGDGSSETGPGEDPPTLTTTLTMGDQDAPGGDGMSEESPGEDPPPTPTGTLHQITPG